MVMVSMYAVESGGWLIPQHSNNGSSATPVLG